MESCNGSDPAASRLTSAHGSSRTISTPETWTQPTPIVWSETTLEFLPKKTHGKCGVFSDSCWESFIVHALTKAVHSL